MSLKPFVVFFVGLWLATPAVAGASTDTCWQTVFDTIARSASAAHPTFTQYVERGSIIQDGSMLQRETLNVTYRDDGLAMIDDSRWSYPMISNVLEPGPPVLGPYGTRRNIWLSLADTQVPYPVISDVRNKPQLPCVETREPYAGQIAHHIALPAQPDDKPGLNGLWLDDTGRVMKVVVNGLLQFRGPMPDNTTHFAKFEVEFEQVGAFTVVRHVTWKYRLRFFDQASSLFGEYYYDGYAFPERLANSALSSEQR